MVFVVFQTDSIILRASVASGMRHIMTFGNSVSFFSLFLWSFYIFASCFALLPLMLVCWFIHSQPNKILFSFFRIDWTLLNILPLLQKWNHHKFIILMHCFSQVVLFLSTFNEIRHRVHEMQMYSVMNDKVNTHVTTTQVKK